MGKTNPIKIGRAKKGLSQDEFAKVMGVSRQTVTNWERKEQLPDVNKIFLISKTLDVPMSELLEHFRKEG